VRRVHLVDADDADAFSRPSADAYSTVAPKKTWSVASRAAGSTTSAVSRRLVRKRMRRSISRSRFLP